MDTDIVVNVPGLLGSDIIIRLKPQPIKCETAEDVLRALVQNRFKYDVICDSDHDYNQLMQPVIQSIEKTAFEAGATPWAEQCAKLEDMLKRIITPESDADWDGSEVREALASHQAWLEEK